MGKGDFDMIQIKYDIVGSFLRPEAIKKARAEFKSCLLYTSPSPRDRG